MMFMVTKFSKGRFKDAPTILDLQIVGEQGRWQRVRIVTNAGHRELFCTRVRMND